jgi:formylglycine-generating enzyme required for sulfatase activity
MYIFRHKNQSKASAAHLTILFILIVLIAGCAPQVPLAGTSTPTAQPQSNVPLATPTPAMGSIQVSPKDDMVMVFVPAGEFEMGGQYDDPSSFPVHTVYLDAFWIDQTEVTNEMFAKFMDSSGYVTDAEKAGFSNEFRPADQQLIWEEVKGLAWNHPDGENSNISGIQEHPVVHVSWNDANAYCTWADRRLPTEAEWEKAASWNELAGEKYRYPWGNDFDGTLLNFCDKNCPVEFAAETSWDDGYTETSPVGSFPDGASPYGALDMSGNVFEWVADWYGANYYMNSPASNPLGPDSGQDRSARGGAWGADIGWIAPAHRAPWEPSFAFQALGFRCALGTLP